MGRTAAIAWHASFSVIAAGLYFFFVLPRWFELTDFIPHTLGTVLRVVTAAVIALAALPVTFTLLRTRKPEHGTPKLALQLRVGSIVAQVAAGVLILGTAISEIWLSLDRFGPWLFGIYGAAAAVALLGIGAFYLSFVAELPPAPPKPIKPKKSAEKKKEPKQRRKSGKKGATDMEDEESADEDADRAAAGEVEEGEEESVASEAVAGDEAESTEPAEPAQGAGAETDGQTDETESLVHSGARHKLPRGTKHKLPTGKRRLRGDR